MPKISVIVPVYNAESYLRRCVDSILSQTFQDFELILVDDGSTDGSGKICDEYAQRMSPPCEQSSWFCPQIKVIHKQNGGVSAARNDGVRESCGDFIAFIDSDDHVPPEYLSTLFRLITQHHAEIAVVKANMAGSTSAENAAETKYDRYQVIEQYETADDERIWAAWGKLISRHILEQYPFPTDRTYGEDLAVVYQWLFAASSVVDYPKPLYNYTYNESGLSKQSFSINRLGMLQTKHEFLSFLKANKFRESYARQLDKYLVLLAHYSEKLDTLGDKTISSQLKKEIKYRLRTEPGISIKTHPQCYNCVYPTRMRVYWTASGIINKVKRLFRAKRK